MDFNLAMIIVLQLLVIAVIAVLALKSKSKNKYYEDRYSKIIDVDTEVIKVTRTKDDIDKSIEIY